MWRRPAGRCAAACLAALGFAGAASADSVAIVPERDATLIEDTSGGLASGSGPAVFAGRIASTINSVRRAVLRFDVAAAVPAGATIEAARLRLHVSTSNSGPTPVRLHRVLASWGEGASSSFGGNGAPALPGDATWIHRFHDGTLWTSPGGDFDPVAHAEASVDQVGFSLWDSTPGIVADVQSWLDDAASNSGWILLGDESRPQTAKRFDSRESPDPSLQPVLEIVYSVPCRPDPLGFGAWKQACARGLDASVTACASSSFAALGLPEIDTCGAVLAAPPPSCDARAARKLAGLVLNLCANRLQTSCPVDPGDGACASGNVGDRLGEIAALLKAGDCRRAAACAGLPD
jgi:hypothetical protein